MVRLKDVGERRMISEIISLLNQSSSVAVGPGDDCAALLVDSEYILLTTDMIHGSSHIHEAMSPWQIGWFIVAINLSDIASKGGKPLGVLLSCGFPKEFSVEAVKQIINGANACATINNTTIIGGDLKEAAEITLTGTGVGSVKQDFFMSRRGCKAGDIVAVTGSLGGAGAGLYFLSHQIRKKDFVKRLFEPIPRIKEGVFLAEQRRISASMDISDGLSSSLHQLASVNDCGFEIYANKIPCSPLLDEIKVVEERFDLAVHSGGDYELLVTIPPSDFEGIQKRYQKLFDGLTPIGVVSDTEKVVLVDDSGAHVLPNLGYEHFIH